MADVYRVGDDAYIRLFAAEYDESEALTVAQAREVAAKLTDYADAIDAEIAGSRALCERHGHDWLGADMWTVPPGGTTADQKVHIERCQRRHCAAQRTSPGWRDETEAGRG